MQQINAKKNMVSPSEAYVSLMFITLLNEHSRENSLFYNVNYVVEPKVTELFNVFHIMYCNVLLKIDVVEN